MPQARRSSVYTEEGETMTPEGGHLRAVHPVVGVVNAKDDTGELFVRAKDGHLTLLRPDQKTTRGKDGKLRLKTKDKNKKGMLVVRIRRSDKDAPNRRFLATRQYRVAGKQFGALEGSLRVRDVMDQRVERAGWFAHDAPQRELEDRLATMLNGQFFIRYSHEQPERAFVLVHRVFGVDQSWLLVVDSVGVGLKRTRTRFKNLYGFVMFYAQKEQRDLDIPLNLGHRKVKVKRRSAPKKKAEVDDDWRVIRSYDYDRNDKREPEPEPEPRQAVHHQPPMPMYPLYSPQYPPQAGPVIHVHIDNSGMCGASDYSYTASPTPAQAPAPAAAPGYVEEATTYTETTYYDEATDEYDAASSAAASPAPRPGHSPWDTIRPATQWADASAGVASHAQPPAAYPHSQPTTASPYAQPTTAWHVAQPWDTKQPPVSPSQWDHLDASYESQTQTFSYQ